MKQLLKICEKLCKEAKELNEIRKKLERDIEIILKYIEENK